MKRFIIPATNSSEIQRSLAVIMKGSPRILPKLLPVLAVFILAFSAMSMIGSHPHIDAEREEAGTRGGGNEEGNEGKENQDESRGGGDDQNQSNENAPPEVRITEPDNNSVVSGRVQIRGIIIDEQTCIANLAYALENETEWHPLTCNSGSFTLGLNTSKHPDGPLHITFRAFDGKQNTTLANFTIIIRNSPGEEKTSSIDLSSPISIAAYPLGLLAILSVGLFTRSRSSSSASKNLPAPNQQNSPDPPTPSPRFPSPPTPPPAIENQEIQNFK